MKQINQMADTAETVKRAYVYSGFSGTDHNILCGPAHKKVPPYNTGKVLIGIHYQPRPKYQTSVLEDRLQAALLDVRESPDELRDRWFMRALYAIGLIGLITIIATR